MRKYLTFAAGILISVFFALSPALADKKACDPVDEESVLIGAIGESPQLFMTKLQGQDLDTFFERMRAKQMLVGSIGVDEIYIFYSENHPHWVYVYFLNNGCILDVKLTFKNLVQYFLTGDESLITKVD